MADVRLENITKMYGKTTALKNVSFECREAEFFTLLGPSGAGKTTTLELIAGIKKPDSGSIFIGGRRVEDIPPQDRDVAMAFESYALYSHFSVYDNIAFPLRSTKRKEKLSQAQECERVEKIASILGIDQLLERKPQQLSGGQKQRVSLARAMVRRPKVYLLDEPIAHLDAKLRASARTTLKQLANEFGTTIVYVTHNYREALALSDRILVLRKGTIQQIGTPEEVYTSPSNDFTALLIGEPPINLIDGEIISENGNVVFRTGNDFSFPIRKNLIGKMEQVVREEGGKRLVRIGIRPNQLKISKQKVSEASFELRIYVVVHEDESSIITFELRNTFIRVKTASKTLYRGNENVWINIDQDFLYFFRQSIDVNKQGG